MLKFVLLTAIFLLTTQSFAEDLGARYKEVSPGVFNCVLPSGIPGMNPNFLGECGVIATNEEIFVNKDLRGLVASGSMWSSASSLPLLMTYVALDNAKLNGMSFKNIRGEGPSFAATNFRRSTLMNVSWTGGAFNYADFSRTALDDVRFDRGWMPHSSFRSAAAKVVSFASAALGWADFSNFDCQVSCSFNNSYMRGADLRGADLWHAQFVFTDLRGAVFDQFTRLPFSRGEAFRRGMVER